MRDKMMRIRMMRIMRKRRMSTIGNKHNDADNDTTIKRKRTRDEDAL